MPPEGERIHLRDVEAFTAVVGEGSISGAAERLRLTQPALTARIQGLEESLGAPLFVRSRSGARLTEAGRTFLPFAERALAALAEGRELVSGGERAAAGRLTLGAAPAVSTYVLPAVLGKFQALHPGVQLTVRSGHSEEILEWVRREEVQLGMMRPVHHPDVTLEPLFDDELVLVVRPGHPFTERGRIRMEQMASERLILFDRASSYHELTSAVFRQAGIRPHGYLEVDNIDAAKRMVEEGLGIALLPRTSVAGEVSDMRLAAVKVTDMTPIRRTIVVARRRDAGDPPPIVAAFLRTLGELRPDPGRSAPNRQRR